MSSKQINLVNDFTDCPGGRHRCDGEYSGEEFRDEILRVAMEEAEFIAVNMNGAFTIPPSFLDESFGVLVDEMGIVEFKRRFAITIDDDLTAKHDFLDILEKHSRSKRRMFSNA